MSNFKNRIITISGEPASGKSTVIKELKKYYEEQGLLVHISTIGHEFRKIAEERGMSIKELNKYMEKRSGIDEYIDSQVARQGKEINNQDRPDEIFIFDSRLAWYNIPESMSVRLTVDSNIAGKRVFEDKTRGKEDQYDTLEDAIVDTEKRKQSEIERYKSRYGVDLQDINNYNLVIDTSFSKVEDIAEVIEKCLELEMQEKSYGKLWTSPKKLLPMQSEMMTLDRGTRYAFDDMVDILKRDGYKPSEVIDIIIVDGRKYIIEGHHRNFASGNIGKTMVPYEVLATDDEIIPGTHNTARKMANLNRSNLLGHEWMLEYNGEKFSYNHIYPGIYEEIEKKKQPSAPPQGDDR